MEVSRNCDYCTAEARSDETPCPKPLPGEQSVTSDQWDDDSQQPEELHH